MNDVGGPVCEGVLDGVDCLIICKGKIPRCTCPAKETWTITVLNMIHGDRTWLTLGGTCNTGTLSMTVGTGASIRMSSASTVSAAVVTVTSAAGTGATSAPVTCDCEYCNTADCIAEKCMRTVV